MWLHRVLFNVKGGLLLYAYPRSGEEMLMLEVMNEKSQGCTGTAEILEWKPGTRDSSLPFRLLRSRCCGGSLSGTHQGDLGRVGGAGIRIVLSCGGRRRVSDGLNQQHLAVLRWICHIQILLHAPYHHYNVSS